jgi:hypothetical protein
MGHRQTVRPFTPPSNPVVRSSTAAPSTIALAIPTYVLGLRARADLTIDFVGIDRHESGVVDFPDADHDGVVDSVLEVPASSFPTYFRIVVNGGKATYSVVSSPVDVIFLDDQGTTMVAAGGPVKGTTGAVKIRITIGSQSAVITIPMKFI